MSLDLTDVNFAAYNCQHLNAGSRQNIINGINLIASRVQDGVPLDVPTATKLIRRETGVARVPPVTVNRITAIGTTHRVFQFDGEEFTSPKKVEYLPLHTYVRPWALDTVRQRNVGQVINRVVRILAELGQPTVNSDIIRLTQSLYDDVDPSNRREWDALSSFRSFGAWLIDKGLVDGDRDLLWAPDRLTETPIVVGQYRARTRRNTGTTSQNEYTWDVTLPDGTSTVLLETEGGVRQALSVLAEEERPDVVDVGDLFTQEGLYTLYGVVDPAVTDPEAEVISGLPDRIWVDSITEAPSTGHDGVEFSSEVFDQADQDLRGGLTRDNSDTPDVDDSLLNAIARSHPELLSALRNQVETRRIHAELEALQNDITNLLTAVSVAQRRVATLQAILDMAN